MDPVEIHKTGNVAVLRVENPPVNALSQSVRAGLLAALTEAEADPDIKAVVLAGRGRAFIAGADIKEFGKPLMDPFLPDICSRFENSDLLVVASLHGVSLGGGLEIALASHFRIAQPDARMGLPEVTLGLIPGAGGTQRLPRLIGVNAAVDMISTGRQVPAREAAQLGLIDALRSGDPEEVGVAYARELIAQKSRPRRVCDIAAPAPANWAELTEKVTRNAKGRVAPRHALEAIKVSTEQSFAEGLATERRLFLSLMETDQRDSLVHAFFAERHAGQRAQRAVTPPRSLRQIGVVGGGTMGAGIATNALLSGFRVVLVEVDSPALVQAENRITAYLEGALSRGKIGHDQMEEMLSASLSLTTDFDNLAQADLVIEAIYEDLDAKRDVFRKLDALCKRDAVLATNTSYLDIDAMAQATKRPERIVGLHFFSPAHVMKLLEVVVTERTSPDVVTTAFAFAKQAGKLAVEAGNCDGFIGNRILRSCRAAADVMVLNGAEPQDVDAALRAFGFAMGPYEVADMAGLDIAWAMRKRRAASGVACDTPAEFADRLCQEGHFGRKTGAGYYLHGQQPVTPHDRALELIAQERAAKGIAARQYTEEDIQRFYLVSMVNEAAQILHEGIARCPSDIDVVLLSGYGFPRHRGGPCKWADQQGLAQVLTEIEAFSSERLAMLTPSKLLRDLAQRGACFDDLNAASRS